MEGNLSELSIDGPSVLEDISMKFSGTVNKVAGDISFDSNFVVSDRVMYIQPGFYIETDPGAVEVDVADDPFVVFSLHTDIADLEQPFPSYIQPLLLQTNFSDLELSGGSVLMFLIKKNNWIIYNLPLIIFILMMLIVDLVFHD